MTFEFATSDRIFFGPGRIKELPDHARRLGRAALLVTGRNTERAEASRGAILGSGVSVTSFVIEGEPTVEAVKEGVAQARGNGCDLIIGFGGGSVIDAAKAIAALSTNRRPALDYLEVIGKGEALSEKPLPTIAVPTTAGTGAEVTRNAVLTSPEHKVKVSLRHPSMLPSVALLDPELTYSLPANITATTGLDALTQLIEPFVSNKANPITDAICREGISLVGRALPRAIRNGQDAQARSDMMLASLFGGMALANAGLGAVHGFAGPLGGILGAPHGALCAAMLPSVIRMNFRKAVTETKSRYRQVAKLLGADDAAAWVENILREFGIQGLRVHGASEQHFPEMIAKAKVASSMRANPVELSDAELREILQNSL